MLPLFYISSWPIVKLFPENELAARWLQVVCSLVAPWIMFDLIRRRFSLFCAAVAVMPVVFFFSQYTYLAWHLRGYGLLFLGTVLAVLALDQAPDKRTKRWIAANSIAQVLLVSAHPFGILYCGLLGGARALADWFENKTLFNKSLIVSYIPAALAVLAWTPAIFAAQKLMNPKPWQPPTSFQNLQAILFPGFTSLWFMVFLSLALLPLLYFSQQEKPKEASVGTPIFIKLVPLAFLAGTLMIWAYSLAKPLYLDRYFSPNIWAWCILAAMLFQKISNTTPAISIKLSLVGALLIGTPMFFHTLGPSGEKQTRDQIEVNHVLFKGTMDNQIIDSGFPVFTSDLNVFMERMHYNPHALDYRSIFERPGQPLDPNVSNTERFLTEGMVKLGMPSEKLLDPVEAVQLAMEKGGATYIGVKRPKETQRVLADLKSKGFTVQSREINIGGMPLFVDVINR
jgi:hypothetical protein